MYIVLYNIYQKYLKYLTAGVAEGKEEGDGDEPHSSTIEKYI